MALIDYRLDARIDKVQQVIDRYKAFEPKDGYYLAFSGGKDSVIIKALADMAGVKYDAHYSVTSVDPPELVQFIKAHYPDVSRIIPRDKNGDPITMWSLIPRKLMPPTRIVRYCCTELKETQGKGRLTVTGVRWAESVRRRANQGLVNVFDGPVLNMDNADTRRMAESCYRTRKTLFNPIIDWTDADVWEFIRAYNIPYCGLYDDGYKRLGCIGCPMTKASARRRGLGRWPTYYTNYLAAFGRMLDARRCAGKDMTWKTPEDVMTWWLDDSKIDKPIPGQIDMWGDVI